jgi:hypothetical protein
MATRWEKVDDNEAASIIGEGLHTGFRKGSSDPKAADLWNAVHDCGTAWSDGLSFLIWGLDVMGMALCKKVETDDSE